MDGRDRISDARAALASTIAARVGDSTEPQSILRLVESEAADEQLALASMLKLAEESPAAMRSILADPSAARSLVFCAGASETVGLELGASGIEWPKIFASARTATLDDLLVAMYCDVPNKADRAGAIDALSRFKRAMYLRIIIADLCRAIDVEATMTAMSRLADECIRAALDAARRIAGERSRSAGEFCVLAMGKLGAEELNLSSDIDLVYIFDAPDIPQAQPAASRLGAILTELLSAGCFRIDMRLRPGGRNSPLVVPFGGALSFYQSLGQTWERAALLRARPVAGSISLGERMLEELRPFIYRRFLDFDTLRQLRAMKHQIESELRSPDLIDRDVKLGYGGIRELEFIVQSLTLIYGGRDPRLRTKRTLEALGRLAEFGYLPAARAKNLADAYWFLRDVEHKLQIVASRQTHTLPADDAGMRALATRLRFGKDTDAGARLRNSLRINRELVAFQFRDTLAGGDDERASRASHRSEAAWMAADTADAPDALKALGFARPEESAAHLAFLLRGPSYAAPIARRHELLTRLGPLLLEEMSALPDPDLAIQNLASFIGAVGARTSFLALLEQHPATRRVLLKLFASSRYLSTLFIRHPDMLDTLVRSDLARARRDRREMQSELTALTIASPDFESQLDAIRTFRHQELLRIAIADLAGALEAREVEQELTALAEIVLAEAARLSLKIVGARIDIPAEFELCVVAMGRLGAAEMSYNSDLDLVFIYQGEGANRRGHEIASRVAQKLIAILETRTREGYAYKIDLRLRPSGNQGPLVTSLDGFRDYHRHAAAVWERQSMVRARAMWGSDEFKRRFEEAREEIVYGRGLTALEIEEIKAMRERMEREIGIEDETRLNLKQGRGGLVDAEFVAQMMALAHGRDHRALRVRSTRELLAQLRQDGLVDRRDAADLAEGYEFLARLENRLRIETDQAAWAIPRDPDALRPIALRMGYAGANASELLLEELRRRREAMRAAFERCFALERRRAS